MEENRALVFRYTSGEDAPVLVAKSQLGEIEGHLPETHITVAEPELASPLGKLAVGEAVPDSIYQEVAEILASVYLASAHSASGAADGPR